MAHETLLVETRGRVGLITLNRPQALNALNRQLLDELRGVRASFEADAGIGAVVLTGSEKAFA
ncbi:MAG: enoyl-CoA hydratase/isomerase family protein, partial [Rhizobiales bacterium]|nr:enoyl-CoA hydratase/isomerase family protein [Hyphomicrobiales bacterium]